MTLAAESMADEQAREKEEEEQGACGSCGATISHPSSSNEQWIENGRMVLYLDSEKQHKEASVRGYINWRQVQWLVCGRCDSAHALHMHIPVPYHAETLVWRGSSGDCGDHQVAPPSGMHERTG